MSRSAGADVASAPFAPKRAVEGSLQFRFDEVARQFHDRVALRCGALSVTYGALRAAASRVAERLRAQGVGAGDLVGLCVSRNVGLVAAMLGVHRAGAAYVPLDPTYPRSRLRYMLQDSGCACVLTDRAVAGAFPALLDLQTTVVVDEAVTPGPSCDEVVTHTGPVGLSHVIYTSGSTGRPKAVCVEQRNVHSLLAWAEATFDPEELGGMLASTSVCFDLSVFEIFAPLTTGGVVLLVDNLLALREQPFFEDVRLVNSVPSVLREYLRVERLPAAVKVVCAAGEPFPHDLAESLHAAGVPRIFNLYGPSEDTTYSTGALVLPADAQVPIGRPLPGTFCYVLDDSMERCPVGHPGELYLGGAGVTRGYLGRPALTADRFLPDPYSEAEGARMYRTGDLVQVRDDGSLCYLGRFDQQVKIRGFRIELGEIETALRRLPGVEDAAVAVHAGPAGDPRLVAYIVGATQYERGELRSALAETLPQYMVPAWYVPAASLPQTSSGKLDRSALPSPEWRVDTGRPRDGRGATGQVSVLSRLTEIWAEVLGRDDPGPGDRFADIGGDSLLATRVLARIREAFHVDADLSGFFEHPTLGEQAEWITGGKRQRLGPWASVEASRRSVAPLSSAQRQLWLASRLDGNEAAYNVSGAVLVEAERVDLLRLEDAWNGVLQRHDVLRSRFELHKEGPIQDVQPVVRTSLEVRCATGTDFLGACRLEAVELASEPLRLERGETLRARLVSDGSTRCALVFAVHHAVFDEWSLGILVRELAALYRKQVLPELAMGYSDYAAWEESLRAGSAYARRLRDWRSELESAPVGRWLRFGASDDPASVTGESGVVVLRLPEPLVGRVRAQSRALDVTPFMWLLAAFQVLVQARTGEQDFIVGTAVGGRRALSQTEALIGCFTNTVPVRMRAASDWRSLVASVRRTCLQALSAADVSLEAIVGAVQPARRAGDAPLLQLAFGVHGGDPVVETNSGRFQGCEFDNGSTRLGLTLWVELGGGNDGACRWTFDRGRFTEGQVQGLHEAFQAVATRVAESTDVRSADLLGLAVAPTVAARGIDGEVRMTGVRRRLGGRGRKPIRAGALATIDRSSTDGGPALVCAADPSVDLVKWLADNRRLVTDLLEERGGALCRGFAPCDTRAFRDAIAGISSRLLEYRERSSPRNRVEDAVYTSTEHPPDQPIVLHNEQSYTTDWPTKISFYCSKPARAGGGTPTADVRSVLRALERSSPACVRRFEKLGVCYVRNYSPRLSLSWQTAFQTDSAAEVERYCARADIECEWLPSGVLRTRQVRQAFQRHPITGQWLWFNHAFFFNVESLQSDVAAAMRASFSEGEFPYQTYYGDGSPIELETLHHIRSAYDANRVSFVWRAGDLLVLDNMLRAHGRESFEGERLVWTVMSDPYSAVTAATAKAAESRRPA